MINEMGLSSRVSYLAIFVLITNVCLSQELATRLNSAVFMNGNEFQTHVDYYFNKNLGATIGMNFGWYSDPLSSKYYDVYDYKQLEMGLMRRHKLGKSVIEPFYSVRARFRPANYHLNGIVYENTKDYWLNGGLVLETGFELNITKKLATSYGLGVVASNGTVNTGLYFNAGFRYSFFYNE
ncbi:MAG: hypothetical protein RLY35_1905 [Bacteroidota bacterium]